MRLALLAATITIAACGDHEGMSPDARRGDAVADVSSDAPAFEPGLPLVLTASSPGNDEDPAVLRARDGSIYVAWFSESAGNKILITRTLDGTHWTAPTHVSTGAAIDLGPTLYQDAAGIIHAVWFRWSGNAPPGNIVHVATTAPDGIASWGAEVDVTTANATDDWVPALSANPAGDLVVAFARNTCPPPTCYGIAASTSMDGGATWSTPVTVVSATSSTEHFLPALANTGNELVVAWDPYDEAASLPYESPMTGSFVSVLHSTTGATWTNASDLTTRSSSSVSVFPTLFEDHGGAWHAAWVAGDSTGTHVVTVPLASPSTTPAMLPIDGYSPRVVATPTPGVFLAAWVGGAAGERDIYVRVFAM